MLAAFQQYSFRCKIRRTWIELRFGFSHIFGSRGKHEYRWWEEYFGEVKNRHARTRRSFVRGVNSPSALPARWQSGAGKTTLSLQYLIEGVKAGEKCLYITLSETKEELIAGAKSHGWSLDGIEIVELIADEKDLDSDAQVTMYPPSEVELTETTKRILDAVERINPSRVIFDSLSEMRLLAQSSLRYRRQILALKQFFIGRNCTVISTRRPHLGRL